jgi:hypothetical protein
MDGSLAVSADVHGNLIAQDFHQFANRRVGLPVSESELQNPTKTRKGHQPNTFLSSSWKNNLSQTLSNKIEND